MFEGGMDSARFIGFLKKLRKDAGKPILVVADNAKYHHSKATQRFIDEQDGGIMLVFLPAYSPELNPDEQVWNHTKARLGKCSIFNKSDMKRHLTSILQSIQNTTRLIRSFFRMPDTHYIIDATA
jgi:transposase